MSRSCSPNAVSPSTMSASIAGCNGSHRSSSKPHDRRDGHRATAGSSMRGISKIAGRWTYLYRAVDQHGQVVDVLLSAHRDLAAARRFFTRALRAGTVPVEVTTCLLYT